VLSEILERWQQPQHEGGNCGAYSRLTWVLPRRQRRMLA
jgi:hypothetical protein